MFTKGTYEVSEYLRIIFEQLLFHKVGPEWLPKLGAVPPGMSSQRELQGGVELVRMSSNNIWRKMGWVAVTVTVRHAQGWIGDWLCKKDKMYDV